MDKILPAPPTGTPYIVEFLVGLLSLCLVVAGYLYRDHSKYRDRREAEDRSYREQQLAEQKQHYKDVAAARDAFRANYETNTNARLDGFDDDAKAFHSEIRSILEKQQEQIRALDRQLYGLNHKAPPKEGG